jgi:hypothetical protein
MPQHEHDPEDRQRDAAALYRAVLNQDLLGVKAVVNNTDCQLCLAAETAIVGIMIADAVSQPVVLDDDDMPIIHPASETRFEDGWPVIPAPKRLEIQLYLDGLTS